jgi:hypothetical protein
MQTTFLEPDRSNANRMNQTIISRSSTLKAMHTKTKTRSVSNNWLISIILFFGGCLLNTIAYKSIEPFILACAFFLIGAMLLLTVSRCMYEGNMYRITFAVGWFMAGIAAIYVNCLNDPLLYAKDAYNFYYLASGRTHSMSLAELVRISEGAGAIIFWRFIYEVIFYIGFEKGPYIGILVNVISVTLTGVLSIKIAKHIFDKDVQRLNRLILLFSTCGIFWLFASIHLRDAVVLLGVTSLAYFWVWYLAKPQLVSLVLLISSSVLGFLFFGFLRTEFVFVPFAMLMAGLVATLLYSTSKGYKKLTLYAITFLGVVIAVILYVKFHDTLFIMLTNGYEGYLEGSLRKNSSDSLGNRFITTAPLPLRLIFGSAYLFVFPIPFWAGLQLEKAAPLFKSFNVLFFYAVTPLFSLALLRIYQIKTLRGPPLMFLLFVVIGFTFSIAGTSLETRHFGAFLVPLLVVATLPNLTDRRSRRTYKKLLFTFLSMMGMVHFAWFFLKFV